MSAASVLRPREAEVVALSDMDLVEQLYELVPRVADDELGDEFYWLLQEAFERWAPHAEWAQSQQHSDTDRDVLWALMARRARARAEARRGA